MADRNLTVAHRGGIYTTRDGMELHVPPSGFDFRSAAGVGVNIDPYLEDNAVQQYPLGTKLVYGIRAYRYTLFGATGGVAGDLYTSHNVVAGHVDETISAAAKGDKTIDFTPSATAITLNEYRDGFLNILSGTGLGRSYQILSHPAESTGSTLFTITLIDPIALALASTPKGTLHQSPWGEVVPAAANTKVGFAAGFAQGVITLAQFGWLQTRGPGSVTIKGSVVKGDNLVTQTTVVGAVGPRTTALDVNETVVAVCMEASATDDDTVAAFITID